MSTPALPIALTACPRCNSQEASFVRFMLWNGRPSTEVEVSVMRCEKCGRKYVVSKKLR